MISVLTGDIINSRKISPDHWLNLFKSELNLLGSNPEYWEIYGGDTFQLRIDDPQKALLTAIRLKAAVKTVKPLDVRLAIGIGDITYKSDRITECNGSAFIYSGEKYNLLKKEKQKLAVKSVWPDFDELINVCLKLAMIAMDKWSVHAAETVRLTLSQPSASQADLGKILEIRQNAVSTRLTRAHFGELTELNELYRNKLIALV